MNKKDISNNNVLHKILIMVSFLMLVSFTFETSKASIETLSYDKIYYEVSVKLVTNLDLESTIKEIKISNTDLNNLNLSKTPIKGGFYIQKDKDGNLNKYPLKKSSKIYKKLNGNLDFELEDGTKITGIYNLYEVNVLVDNEDTILPNQEKEKILKESKENILFKNKEYISIKSESNYYSTNLSNALLIWFLLK